MSQRKWKSSQVFSKMFYKGPLLNKSLVSRMLSRLLSILLQRKYDIQLQIQMRNDFDFFYSIFMQFKHEWKYLHIK